MMTNLKALHPHAARQGDGLRSEFLRHVGGSFRLRASLSVAPEPKRPR